MTSLHRWLASPVAAVLVLAGCASSPPPDLQDPPEEVAAPGELITSDKPRVTAPSVPGSDFAALVAGNTDLGASLYRRLAKPGENLFFSPLSISQGFAMVYAGARGNTEAQMAQALHFSLPQARLHPAMNALDAALQSHAGVTGGDQGTAPTFRAVNAAWGQRGLTFEPAFLDVLAQHYGSGMRAVDFSAEPDTLRQRINTWVEGQTAGRIEDLLPEGTVKSDTRLVLTNALYFKGAWRAPFDPAATQAAPFRTLEGGTRQVQMMRGSVMVPLMKGDGFDAVALPYVGRAFRMLAIVPHEGRFAEVESRLSAGFLDGVRAGLKDSYVGLRFPRFEVKQEFPLAEPLRALGMVDAFSDRADFSGLTRQEALMLQFAQHQAFVSVDEQGTEAAAATGIGAGPVSLPEPFVVDRPFLFLIEDVETKGVLFLGRVVSP
jgi:serpin B